MLISHTCRHMTKCLGRGERRTHACYAENCAVQCMERRMFLSDIKPYIAGRADGLPAEALLTRDDGSGLWGTGCNCMRGFRRFSIVSLPMLIGRGSSQDRRRLGGQRATRPAPYAMAPRRSLARRFMREMTRDRSMRACDAGPLSTLSCIARTTLRAPYRQITSKLRPGQRRARSTSATSRFEKTADRRTSVLRNFPAVCRLQIARRTQSIVRRLLMSLRAIGRRSLSATIT